MQFDRHVRPWMFVAAAWIGPAILGAVDRAAQSRIYHEPRPGLRQLLFASGDWLLYAFLTPAVFAIAHRWPTRQRWRPSAHTATVC